MVWRSPNTHYGAGVPDNTMKKASSDGATAGNSERVMSADGEGKAHSQSSRDPSFRFAGQGEQASERHEKPSARHPGETKKDIRNTKGRP